MKSSVGIALAHGAVEVLGGLKYLGEHEYTWTTPDCIVFGEIVTNQAVTSPREITARNLERDQSCEGRVRCLPFKRRNSHFPISFHDFKLQYIDGSPQI